MRLKNYGTFYAHIVHIHRGRAASIMQTNHLNPITSVASVQSAFFGEVEVTAQSSPEAPQPESPRT
jgi:hypothetical protein